MSFARGHRKLGGRRPGVPNRVTAEGRELARRLIEDPQYQRSLRRRLIRGEAGPPEVVLWQYVVGKPKDPEPPTDPQATLAATIAQVRARTRGDAAAPDPPRLLTPSSDNESTTHHGASGPQPNRPGES